MTGFHDGDINEGPPPSAAPEPTGALTGEPGVVLAPAPGLTPEMHTALADAFASAAGRLPIRESGIVKDVRVRVEAPHRKAVHGREGTVPSMTPDRFDCVQVRLDGSQTPAWLPVADLAIIPASDTVSSLVQLDERDAAERLAAAVTDLLVLIGSMTFGPDDNVAPVRRALADFRAVTR